MAKRPMFAMGLSAFLSVLFCSYVSLSATAVVVAVSLVVLGGMACLCRVPFCKAVAFCAVGAFLASGLFLLKDCTVVYEQLAYADQTATVTMQVTEPIPSGSGYIVNVTDGNLPKDTKLLLRITRKDIVPTVGDLLYADVQLTALFEKDTFDDAAYAKANGVYLQATFVPHTAVLWTDGFDRLSLTEQTLYRSRQYIHNAMYQSLSFDRAALSEGVLLGTRSNIDEQTEWEFRASGVYHLLAVSGQHLSMLVGVLFWLLDTVRIRRRRGAIVGMVISVLFTALCGFSPSVTRACAMTILMLVGHLFRRRPDGLNSLGFAALVMILADPFVIYDIGFQLSVASTLGIVLMFPVWYREFALPLGRKVPFLSNPVISLLSAIGLALTATLFTQPLTALYFGELSLVFLPGNLICVPLSSVLLVLCLVFAVLYMFVPSLAELCAVGMRWMCDGMTQTAKTLSSLPYATVCANAPFAVLWVFLLALMIPVGYILMKKKGVAFVAVGMAAVLLALLPVQKLLYRDVTTIVPIASASPTVLVKNEEGCGLIFEGDSKTLSRAATTLQREGVKRLSWLLWLNAPADSIADTSMLGVPIEQLVLCESEDAYVSLPDALTTVTLKSNGTLRFGAACTLLQHGDDYRVTIGETSLLILSEGQAVSALSEEWHDPDLLLLEGKAPEDIKRLKPKHIVVYGSLYELEQNECSIPRTFSSVYMLGRDAAPVFFTRGDGDMTLRSY